MMLFGQQVERTNKVEPQAGGLFAMQSFAILMNVSFVIKLSPISWYYSGKPMQSFAILMTFCFSVTSLSYFFSSGRICVWV